MDNSGALVQYQPSSDLSKHFLELLKQEHLSAEDSGTASQPWENVSDVNNAFTGLQLDTRRGNGTITKDPSLMPSIPRTITPAVCTPFPECRRTATMVAIIAIMPAAVECIPTALLSGSLMSILT